MKRLLALFLTIFSATAFAQTGFFYNEDRAGEGIIVTIKGDLLAFALFTYWDARISIPPVVSPMPPEFLYPTLWTSCPTYNFAGQIVPPVFSPAPPEEEAVTYRGGAQAWFIGFGTYRDGIAIGEMFTRKAADYPNVTRTIGLAQEFSVGTFLIEKSGNGFDFYLDCNGFMPKSLFMCTNVLHFRTLLIGQ